MRQLVIIGSGGFGQEAAWVAESMNEELAEEERWQIRGYLDDNEQCVGRELYGYKVLGRTDAWVAKGPCFYYCAIGRNAVREAMSVRADALGWLPATLIHRSVVRARQTEVGAGTFIGPGCILSPNSVVGRHVIINQRVSVGHDARMEDFSQACPGAQINGNCRIGRGALVGSNASIHQGKAVGECAVVGANSQVITHVRARTSVCGVPAMRVGLADE